MDFVDDNRLITGLCIPSWVKAAIRCSCLVVPCVVIDALLSLARLASNEIFMQYISPSLKVTGLACMAGMWDMNLVPLDLDLTRIISYNKLSTHSLVQIRMRIT
jgi:hypothetical protein